MAPAKEGNGTSMDARLAPLLPEADSLEFRQDHGALIAELGDAARVEVRLPLRAAGTFRVESRASGVAVEAKLVGASDARAEVGGGYVVYPGGAPGGGSLIQRVHAEGTEDYITLERRPEQPRVVYTIALSAEVAGVRLVSNTLEFVSALGNPEIRVAPPYLVGADGKRFDAALDVEGCDVDRDPSAPWDRAPTKPGKTECQVVVTWDDAELTYPALLDPAWTATGNLATARMNHGAASAGTDRVVVAGGWNGSAMLASAELYNHTTKTWAATGSMAAARMDHTLTALPSNRVLAVGGGRQSTALSSAERYDRATGVWTSAATVGARYRHTATILPNNAGILVAGGFNGTAKLNTARVYNPSTNAWTNVGNMVVAQASHTATPVALSGQSKVMLLGLASPFGQLYEVATQTWSALPADAQPQTGRQFHSAEVYGGIVVAGGDNGAGTALASADLFNMTTLKFRPTSAMRAARSQFTLLKGNGLNGDVIAAGANSTLGGLTERYHAGLWVTSPYLAKVRYAHAAAPVGNGQIVAGGAAPGASTPMNSAEFYDTAASPQAITDTEVGGAAAIDPLVISDRATELVSSMYFPSPVGNFLYPIILMLHGNHGTCGTGTAPRDDNNSQYTMTGTCPSTHVKTPNHKGYAYIARELAKQNYIVVSISASRGLTGGTAEPAPAADCPATTPNCDPSLILARGKLVLRHLQQLSTWHRGVSTPPGSLAALVGKMNFAQVGLMGHSRGGGGMRAAYALYRDASTGWQARIGNPVTFRGIFEIAPTDFGVAAPDLNAINVRSAVLLPMCDGDIRNLRGSWVLDRSFAQPETNPSFKATYTVWGANHNFYNTEWQISEPRATCTGPGNRPIFQSGNVQTGSGNSTGSDEQLQTGYYAMYSFFSGNVGGNANPDWNAIFDPRFGGVPGYRIDRGYHPGTASAKSLMLEDFLNAAGTSSFNVANQHSNVTVAHGPISEHSPELRAGTISWTSAGANTFFQSNFPTAGVNLTGYQSIDLRVDRADDAALNTSATTSFNVALVNSNGSLSGSTAIPLSLTGPVGGENLHSVLQTARIPVARFSGATLSAIRGIRLTFSSTARGKIYVANIRATPGTGSPGSGMAAMDADAGRGAVAQPVIMTPGATSASAPPPPPRRITAGNSVRSLRSKGASQVQIVLATSEAFLVQDEPIVLGIAAERFSHGVLSSDHKTVTFTMPRAAYDRLATGQALRVGYGQDPWSLEWAFGNLDKSRLDK